MNEIWRRRGGWHNTVKASLKAGNRRDNCNARGQKVLAKFVKPEIFRSRWANSDSWKKWKNSSGTDQWNRRKYKASKRILSKRLLIILLNCIFKDDGNIEGELTQFELFTNCFKGEDWRC
jgi:hypothetical protein